MNVLIHKEVRLLLPSFSLALLLGLTNWLIPNRADATSGLQTLLVAFPFLMCPAMVVMMTLDSFGRELSAGTFPLLLAQPIPRAIIWRTKTLLLAAALLIVLAVWSVSFALHFRELLSVPERSEWRDTMLATPALFALVTFSGGLWTVLCLRQVAAAFWLTLITPAAILVAVLYLMERHPALGRSTLILALILYSVAGFLFARRLFLRAQDVSWTGGTIALPGWRWRRASSSAIGGIAKRRSFRALFVKELQLHQSQFVIAGVLALLHLGVLAVRHYGGDFKNSPTLEFLLGHFWVLWIVMPWLIGCAAVAEERKLGTLEGQLCLPTTRRRQFIIKLLTTLLLSVLFGAMVPVILEGSRILPGFDHFDWESSFEHPDGYYPQFGPYLGEILASTVPLLGLAGLAGLAALIGTMAFYASSFTRNTMQAIAPAALGLIVVWFLWAAASQINEFTHYPLWRGPLIYIFGVPVMTLTLAGLMYGNFKHVLVGWNVWRRNTLVFLASLVGVMAATTTLYHRPWELLTPLEPAHGPARLDKSNPVMLRGEQLGLSAQLPDGRNWATRLTLSVPHDWFGRLAGDWRVAEAPGSAGFLEGTNWASVGRGFPGLIGIQTDGSLWIGDPEELLRRRWQSTRNLGAQPLVRLGTDNDWKSVVYQSPPAFLLKTDGTLWRLGTNRMHSLKEWPGWLNFQPERLGADSDWAEIRRFAGKTIFRKTDGQVWTMPAILASDKDYVDLDAETRIYRAGRMDRVKWPVSHWAFSRRGRALMVGVFDDGSFGVHTVMGPRGFEKGAVRLGPDANWVAVAGEGNNVVTLKADGSLWRWDFGDAPVARPESAAATRLSTHSDWVAITDVMGGVVALAADGGLWFWRFDPVRFYPAGDVGVPWLAVSRRPQFIGNIFTSTGP